MPAAKEIIERANAAFVAAGDWCRSREQEILRQRNAALNGFPAAQSALAAHVVARAKATDDFAAAETSIQDDLAEAEQTAEQAQRDADDDALTKFRTSDDDAAAALQSALAEAQDTFTETLRLLQQTMSTVNADAQARMIREQSVASAQKAFQVAKDKDFQLFRKESAAALDAHTKTVARARRDSDTAMTKAKAGREAALAAADATLVAALNADPLAASIEEAFALQLKQSQDDCEAAKSAILAQMRTDLDAIGP